MTVARLAARVALPGGALVVREGEVEAFLAPVPISLLPIESDLAERLHWLGVQTIGALAQLPSAALQQQFGASGARLHLLARGADPPPARVPRTPDLPVIRVGWRFPGATADRAMLDAALARVAERLAARLEAAGWSARTLTLLLEHEDGIISTSRSLERPTADARILRRLFLALLDEEAIPAPVERVCVEVTPAPRQVRQATMFDDATGESLDDLVARLAGRHGAALLRAEVCEAATSGCFEQQARVLPWEDAV
jgi:protein ImuB